MISVSYVIGMSIAAVLLLVSALLIWLGVRMRRHNGDWEFAWLPIGGGGVLAVAVIALTLGFAWPVFDMEYHRYKPVAGTVDVVQARMLADGNGGMSQMFAVRLREDGTTYRCDDSRCSLLKSGDRLWLRCIREWQYAAQHGWACNYVRSETAS